MGATISAKSLNQLSNGQAILLPKFRAGLAKVKAGTGNCRLVGIGDSTTIAAYATGAIATNNKDNSYISYLASLFSKDGVNTNVESFMSHNAHAGAWTESFDSRVATTGDFSTTIQTATNTVGGIIYKSATAGSKISFTPKTAVDTFKVWYAQVSAGGSFNADVDGGAATTLSCSNATNTVLSAAISAGSLGQHTLDLTALSSSTVFILGVEAYNSAAKSLSVINAGYYGSNSTTWQANAQPYDPLKFLQTLAPDLTTIALGINDWDQGAGNTPVAVFTANIQNIITAGKVTGDVVLISPAPSAIGTATLAVQQAYTAALAGLAAANGIPYYDGFARDVSYETAAPLFGYFDALHPLAPAHADRAQGLYKLLTA